MVQDDRYLWQTLLSGVTATSDGTWVRVKGKHPAQVTIEGTFMGDVQILASNNPRQPLDSFNGAPVVDGVTHSAPDNIKIDDAWEWVKARVTAYTSGSISVFIRSGQGPDAC